MKKILALILAVILVSALALTITSCNKTPTTIISDDGTEIPIIPDDEITKDPHAPGSVPVYSREKLTLAKDPVFEDGKLVLYFNETLSYTENSECDISIISDFAADSIADMDSGDGAFTGIALTPSSEIDAGTYSFSVLIGTYIVETFDLTIQ